MEDRPDPYDLTGPERLVGAVRHAAFVLQHVWPLVLVVGVPVAVGGAFLYQSYTDPGPVSGPVSTASAWGGGAARRPAGSSILVASEPSGATVYVDGDSVGTTPLNVGDLPAGDHRVAVVRAGFAVADTLVALVRGADAVVEVRLTPAAQELQPEAEVVQIEPSPAPPPAPGSPPAAPPAAPPASVPAAIAPSATGRVEVTVLPWGTIFIDGGIRRRDTDVAFGESLAPGPHVVRVEHPTLGARERTVHVQAGRTASVTFDLNDPSGAP
jgi:hypothetical protein